MMPIIIIIITIIIIIIIIILIMLIIIIIALLHKLSCFCRCVVWNGTGTPEMEVRKVSSAKRLGWPVVKGALRFVGDFPV